jgi:hypothetical protein
MLLAGSDDGVYRLRGVYGADDTHVQQVLESGRVRRLRAFEEVGGVVAATGTGLYHSPDGTDWTNLGVPRDKVYSVGADPDGERLLAGTRPARVYVSKTEDGQLDDLEWRELDGFQDLPSRDEWRLPRHENIAQVRDVHVLPTSPDRLVAGVEVGGVHVSLDGGATWTERSASVHDDIHELHVVGPRELVAATGYGLFHTADTGRSWTRLDEGYDQRYFRTVVAVEGVLYAAGALANSSTWEDDDADPMLFASDDAETVERIDHPRPDEMVTGMTGADGVLFAATHRGTILVRHTGEWVVSGSIPVPGPVTGRYNPLVWKDN